MASCVAAQPCMCMIFMQTKVMIIMIDDDFLGTAVLDYHGALFMASEHTPERFYARTGY